MNYTHYTTEDFVTDEYFIQWVKNPTEESNAFWEAWLSKNPSQEPLVKEARQIIQALQFKVERAPEEKFLEIWGNIVEAEGEKVIRISRHNTPSAVPSAQRTRGLWYKVAAALLVAVSALAYIIIASRDATIVVQTAYGESRTLFLPDSTKVTLNANSTLRYEPGFGKHREVWLDGEAFFAVVHKSDHQNFLVHTQELQVEVLGTRFNVNTRRGKSQVVLEEGKVKLDISNGPGRSEVVMKPGEMVEVSAATRQIEKKEVEADMYSSWRHNRLTFVSTSLADLARMLEDNYGYRVQFEEEELKDKLFTGSSSTDDLQELIRKLNRVFNLDIRQEGNRLIFRYQ